VPKPDGCVPGRAGRDREDQRDLTVSDEEEHLQLLAHLDVEAGAGVAGDRHVRDFERAPEASVGRAGARQPVELLEGDDRVRCVDAVVAVGRPEVVVEFVQALLERVDARPRSRRAGTARTPRG
jgi:hypothetical protein